jgi:hypothetical protein
MYLGASKHSMDEMSSNLSEEPLEMPQPTASHNAADLRKRRSTRIVQAVPLSVTGVDAIGRPFTEHTSTLIINCHGCRYQSKHYVLKNMWVKLEVPHPESGLPPRTVRGRVAWIQRPRTVRQLFQVALELENPGNVWSIAFPPEDWFAFQEVQHPGANREISPDEHSADIAHQTTASDEPDSSHSHSVDNLRPFPSPASATDASLQLARQLARLVADAKQQIQAAAREAAAQAVSEEHRVSLEHWDKKFAAAREEVAAETSRLIQTIHEEADKSARSANAAAAEALRNEFPVWLAPQLKQIALELTEQLAREGAAHREEHFAQVRANEEKIRNLLTEVAAVESRLKSQSEETEGRILAGAEAVGRAQAEAARLHEETSTNLAIQAEDTEAHIAERAAAAARTMEEAARVREEALVRLKAQAAQTEAHINDLATQVTKQTARLREETSAAQREALQSAADEIQHQLAASTAARLGTLQQQALAGFHSQIDDVLSLHRNELHRRSQSLFDEIDSRISTAFEDASSRGAGNFDQQIAAIVTPHLSRAEESIHRMAGGRALLDASLSLQQDRIREAADQAFAESLARFRENLGSIEQVLEETSRAVSARNLADLDEKISDIKHQAIQDVFKSAEWYEKKAQTHIQNVTEKAVEQAGAQLHEKAADIASTFASALEGSGRNLAERTQIRMEDTVRDAFDRVRALFTEAAETTSATFTDEIQRTGRQELAGFSEELQNFVRSARADLESARRDLSHQVTVEQGEFLRRFRDGMNKALESGVNDAHAKVQASFSPLLESWGSLTERHQSELRDVYSQISAQATEQHRTRLENISNQWMLATVTSLDHQSREVVASISAAAEAQLRETCTKVFAGIGETLQERLQQIARTLTSSPGAPTDPDNTRSRTATPGS